MSNKEDNILAIKLGFRNLEEAEAFFRASKGKPFTMFSTTGVF